MKSGSDWIFSGMKAFHELNEAFPSMIDKNGDRKPFEAFLNDVRKIDRTYNQNYLRAEYNFVSASAEMAAKWEEFEQDGDRYNLQYRTQRDGRVRPEHAALHEITLPPSDPFWEEFYPPNGWNCRCTVVQVRKSKYPATDRDEAYARGETALQKDAKRMFRFNPGKEESTVPAYNPYTIRRCKDCDIAKGEGKFARVRPGHNEVCATCKFLRGCDDGKDVRIEENRKEYERLKADPNYYDVEFNPENGGLKAIHDGHILHSCENEKTFFGNEKLTSTDLEILCQNLLFKQGYSCILLNETQIGTDGYQLPQLDTNTNGEMMDIRAITSNGANTVKNALKDKKKQIKNFYNKTGEECHAVILYFHDESMFNENQVIDQLGLTLTKIICVFKNGVIKEYKKS